MYFVLFWLLLAGTRGAKTVAEQRPYVIKYVGKWPHCSNIQCLAGRTLAEMQSVCDSAEQCSGFSFSQDLSVGNGCLKDCGEREYGGYGTGDVDYWTLQTGDSDSESAGGSAPAGSWELDVTSVITSAPTASLPFGIVELTIRSLWLAGLQVSLTPCCPQPYQTACCDG